MAKKKSSKKTTKKTSSAPVAPAAYVPKTYTSQYGGQIDAALNEITNFKYDPLQDASYQALAKVYGARGNIAAKDTLADAAALNGGMQTSYAVSAAQQARNQYNQELAARIPELEATAYNRAQTRYNALMDADNAAYGRFRDTESDRQWGWTNQYTAYRDKVADQQWAKEYALSKKGSSGGGGGGGRRSRGGSGGGYTGSTTGGGMPITKEDYDNILNKDKKKYTITKKSTSGYTSYGGGGKKVRMVK